MAGVSASSKDARRLRSEYRIDQHVLMMDSTIRALSYRKPISHKTVYYYNNYFDDKIIYTILHKLISNVGLCIT